MRIIDLKEKIRGVIMNELILNSSIKEEKDNTSIRYILEDSELFFQTGYKVLQNQDENKFIKCGKVTHNGKIKLIYDTSSYKSLKSLLNQLDSQNFLVIISRLLDIVNEVKGNGFMQPENINIGFDKIFVDSNNLNVYLIYLPVNIETDNNSKLNFERGLKANIKSAISEHPNLNSDKVHRLYSSLNSEDNSVDSLKDNINVKEISKEGLYKGNLNKDINFNLGLEDKHRYGDNRQPKNIHKSKNKLIGVFLIIAIQAITLVMIIAVHKYLKLSSIINISITVLIILVDLITSLLIAIGKFSDKSIKTERSINQESSSIVYSGGGETELLTNDSFTPTIALNGVNTPKPINIIINKSEFVIGKNSQLVDGVILFNNAISRIHCTVLCNNGKYFLRDEGSSNGTYINGVRVQFKGQAPIKLGDTIKLANSEFTVVSV